MKYAKIVDPTFIDTNLPTKARLPNGRIVTGDLTAFPEVLAGLGYLLLVETPQPEEPAPAGSHYEARYAEIDGTVATTWVAVADPAPAPRTFSKLKVLEAAAAAGVADKLLALLASDPLLQARWNAATNLREDNAAFAAGLEAAAAATGLSAEAIAAALDGCVVEA